MSPSEKLGALLSAHYQLRERKQNRATDRLLNTLEKEIVNQCSRIIHEPTSAQSTKSQH